MLTIITFICNSLSLVAVVIVVDRFVGTYIFVVTILIVNLCLHLQNLKSKCDKKVILLLFFINNNRYQYQYRNNIIPYFEFKFLQVYIVTYLIGKIFMAISSPLRTTILNNNTSTVSEYNKIACPWGLLGSKNAPY